MIMLKPNRRKLTLATIALSAFATLPATSQTINEDFKITATDGATGDGFGNSIAIDNGVVAVGSHWDDDNGDYSGSVYLFDASTGSLITKLLPSDGAAGDDFGVSIAMDNGIIAAGAMGDSNDNGYNFGSAYLFDASTGAQRFKLLPSDGAADDFFGYSIAIDNNIVAVGSLFDDDSGSAYIFDASTGEQLFKLIPSDRAYSDNFGDSIAMNNGIVAVGASGNDDNGQNSGSAYLFDESTGAQLFKLLPSDGAAGDGFGYSIAIDNGIVSVGAPGDDDGSGSGSVYLFDASTGSLIAKLFPNDGAAFDNFGNSITMNNGIIAVGAIGDDDNDFSSGSAYLFDISTGTQITKLLPSDGGLGDQFGFSIAIDNGVIATGARNDNDNGTDSGSAYLFTLPCPADLTGEGELDFFDISAFLKAFSAMDPAADFTDEGNFNFFDVSAFLQAFSAGCP